MFNFICHKDLHKIEKHILNIKKYNMAKFFFIFRVRLKVLKIKIYLWQSSLYVYAFFCLNKLLKCSTGKDKPELHSVTWWKDPQTQHELLYRKWWVWNLLAKTECVESKSSKNNSCQLPSALSAQSHTGYLVAPASGGDDVCAALSTKKLIWDQVSQILTVGGLSMHLLYRMY